MIRVHDPLQGVALGAREHFDALRLGGRHAGHPLAVGDLVFEIFRSDEAQIVVRRPPGVNRDGRRGGKIVADGANAQPVSSRRQVRDGEAVPSARVGHHRHLDVRSRLARGDEHPFHQAFGRRTDASGEGHRWRRLRVQRGSEFQRQADDQDR
jgi:hypothetical protein